MHSNDEVNFQPIVHQYKEPIRKERAKTEDKARSIKKKKLKNRRRNKIASLSRARNR